MPRSASAPVTRPAGAGFAWSAGAAVALLAVPVVLTVWLAFHAGGFFPGEGALAVVVLAAALVLRAALAAEPFAGLGARVLVPAGALAALTAWTLLSATWSDAAGRALVEHVRPLAYGLTLVLVASVPFDVERLRLLVRLVAAALALVALAGLATRLLPDVWEAPTALRPGRLSWPLTYWNAAGMIAALGALLSLHLACDAREHPAVRATGAAVVPALAAAVLLTFSRGAIAAGVVGVVVYLALARPRGALAGLLATVPASALAVTAAYRADAIQGASPTSAAAASEGHEVALVVGLAMVCAAAVSLTAALLARDAPDRRRRRARRRPSRGVLAGVALAAVVVVAGAAVVAGAPSALGDQAERFWTGDEVPSDSSANLRARLADVGNSGRRESWRVALDGFTDAPLTGQGAGTYQVLWQRERPAPYVVVDAHSLYVETLAELGVAGLVLVLVGVLGVLAGLVSRARGHARPAVAAVIAVWVAWAVRAGLDWDWEMPALTVPVFALAGAALAADAHDTPAPGSRTALPARAAAGAVGVLLAVLPVLVALSQSRIDRAVAGLRDGDCARAVRSATAAADLVPARPEPWEALGYCRLLGGQADAAGVAMRGAAERDPENWEPLYGLALASAAGGQDPRPALQRALALNPREPVLRDFSARADRAAARPSRRAWAASARGLPLLVPQDADAARTVLGTG